MTVAESRTLVESVYRSLRTDICIGRFRPGQRINLSEMAKARGVSLTVVREAAIRLASERFLEATPQQGFRVWPLSVPDLLDLTRVRTELEVLTIRESVALGDVRWEGDLVAAHHRLMNTSPAVGPTMSMGPTDDDDNSTSGERFAVLPNPDWMQAHSEFHAALTSASTSPLLKQLRQQMFDSAELYRHWSVLSHQGRKRGPGKGEHSELLAVALAHDVEGAATRIADHIKRTTNALLVGRVEELPQLSVVKT
jgi:GntR family carbon starvation induced transcriptional regulator